MSSEMVDRATRRLLREMNGDAVSAMLRDPGAGRSWDACWIVRLMIEEMRVPTAGMLSVGRRGPASDVPYDRDAEVVWTDMVDEALK